MLKHQNIKFMKIATITGNMKFKRITKNIFGTVLISTQRKLECELA